MRNFAHQKILEAISLIQVYSGLLTKKQAWCTVTWHAHNTDSSDKFQGEKRFPPLLFLIYEPDTHNILLNIDLLEFLE
jgi:hypothetical protein